MIENTIQVKFKDNPVLLDKVLQDIQKALKEKLSWLDYAFGKAYKLVENGPDGIGSVYPACYNGNGEYVSLLPNDNLGNFSWFDIYDPQEITQVTPSLPQYTYRGAIVFWYDLSSIYADASVLYTEEIKEELIKLLTTPGITGTPGRLEITGVHERLENIYRDYSIQNTDRQFLMYPYAGIRLEFTLKTRGLCY